MKKFMDNDFLLRTSTAKKLFHEYSENLPVIDYHCHINPKEIYEDKHFKNITEIWLYGDHYKWRLARSNGVDEKYITGDGSDWEKFYHFAKSLSGAIGNPMYHWCHLELKKYFGYDGILNEKTAKEVWELSEKVLKNLSVRKIIAMSDVELIGTTDDPADDLKYHKLLREENYSVKVIPSFRPDKAISMEKNDFTDYISHLSQVCSQKINSLNDLCSALKGRMEYFDSLGCRSSDHGMDKIPADFCTYEQADDIFKKCMSGVKPTDKEISMYKTYMLEFLAECYNQLGWVMQIHYSVIRNNNTKMFKSIGADSGFDTISVYNCAEQLAAFLDRCDLNGGLPKTILYSLNPNDNAMLDAMAGCFQNNEAVSKIQHGSAWWFNDSLYGMEQQIRSFASMNILGNFVGMLTDSRSFLSYTRHDYFRRLVCNIIGEWVENGEYPDDWEALQKIVSGISYYNAKRFFEV